MEEKCLSSDTRLSSNQNTESMICPQELFKTNLVGLDDVPLSLAGQTAVAVLSAAEIVHINWILFFPGQSRTALFIQRAEKTATQKRQGRVAPQFKDIYIRSGWKYQDKMRACLPVAVKTEKL